MHTQMTSRYSIVRQSGRFLQALCLAIAIAAGSLTPFVVSTAWAELQDDAGVWGAALARGNFGYIDPGLKRWLWWMEGQARYRDCCNSEFILGQSLIRPGLGYALTDQSTVWMGYARVGNFLPNHTDIHEDRMWEQFIWSQKTPLGAFSSRSRLEQRWQANGSDMSSRFRQFFKLSTPIPFYPTLNFVVWDEVFVNLYDVDWGPQLQSHQGFDQNRAFVGVGYRISPEVMTEIGYMNQYIQTHTAANDRVNHVLSMWLFFDFFKS